MSKYFKPAILLLLICFMVDNSSIVPDIMESRNLVTAREMVDNGNWLIPTMNGKLRLEKPPLPTWVAAVTMMTLGNSWWALRLVPVLMGGLLLMWFYLLARRMSQDKKYAFCGTVILATCYNFVLMAKTVTWDIYCHSFMMGGIYYLYLLLTEKRRCWINSSVSGLLIGLSMMSKGPVSLYGLFLPFVIAFVIGYRHEIINKKYLPITLIVALLVGATWYVYIWMEQHGAGSATFSKESANWLNHNIRPWYYYATFFTETGIWAVLCITSLFFPYWRKRIPDSRHYMFTFIWMAGVLVLLSLLPEKKNRYLLPILIPASMCMAHLVMYWIKEAGQLRRMDQAIYRINVGVLVLAMFLIIDGLLYVAFTVPSILWNSIFVCICFIVAVLLLIKFSRSGVAMSIIMTVYLCFLGLGVAGMPIFARFLSNPNYSSPRELLNKEYPGVPIYSPQEDEFRIELVYDMGRLVRPKNIHKLQKPCLLAIIGDSKVEVDDPVLQSAKKVGTFDGNRHSKLVHRYKPHFCYTLYYFTPKTTQQ